jgi:hypothetical protein
MDRIKELLSPAHAGPIAILLVALGVETEQLHVHHALEVAGALLAIVTFIVSWLPRS